MWIYSRPKNEHDNRFVLNLDLCSRISVNQLGEKWFVEVMLGAEAVPVAAAPTQEEAMGLLLQVFEALRSGDNALDLAAPPEPAPK